MSPMSSLLGYKHLRSWIPLPFAFAGNNDSPSTVDTKSDASNAIKTPEHASISRSPSSLIRNEPIPRPPSRQSSVLTSRHPRTSTVQDSTTSRTLKENTLPPSVSQSSNAQDTTSPPPSSAPILASTPPASPIINPTLHPQRPPPIPLPTSPQQPRGRTLTRSTSARRTLFPSRSSVSLRQRNTFHSNSNITTLHRPESPPAAPPKFPRYLGRHPSIDRLQLRSPRLPPLQEQASLHRHTTPPLLSRPSAERQKSTGSACYYRSGPSRSSSFSSSYRVVEDHGTRLYCGGEEKPGFVKVRSERQLKVVVLRQQGGGGGGGGGLHRVKEQGASDDSGRTTRGGSEVPERTEREVGVGGGLGGDGSCDGLLGGARRGKKREKGLKGKVGRLARRLSVGDRRRRKREMEGEGEWDGEERGKEEVCE